jgi:hypothetical protein
VLEKKIHQQIYRIYRKQLIHQSIPIEDPRKMKIMRLDNGRSNKTDATIHT